MIIGLSGKKQSGKDTLGLALEEAGLAERYAFADSLKNLCSTAFGIPQKVLWGSNRDKNGPSPLRWEDIPDTLSLKRMPPNCKPTDFITIRELLQVFGTDVCRDFYKNFWVNWTIRKIKRGREKNPYHTMHEVITDVRFPNEAKRIKEEGGIVVRLMRDVVPGDSHPSETAMDYWDFDFIHDNRKLTIPESIQGFKDFLRLEGLI